MKVAFSGGGGTGKTTLIKHISSHLPNYTIIHDYIDHELRLLGLSSPKQLSDIQARQVRLRALGKKIKSELETPNFLSDKSVVDYYAYWLIWTMAGAAHEETVKSHVRNYDLVIIPQYGRFEIADNGIRTTNHFHQFRVHALIRGIYGELNIPTKEYSLNLKDSPEKVIEDLRII